jgi:hypothetical protein
MLFRVLWWFDLLVAGVVSYFFLVGLTDGSVSSFNAGLGSKALHAAGKAKLGVLLLLVLAVPGALAALFLILVLTTNPRWN